MHRIARLFSLLIAALVLSFAAQAQDEIQLRNGDVIEAKVRELTPGTIKYQKVDNGPLYTVNRRDVRRIVYESGATEEMDNRRGRDGDNADNIGMRSYFRPGPNAARFGQNVLAVLPIAMTDRSVAGFGLRYERTLDKDGYLSAVLPVVVSLVGENSYYSYGSGGYVNDNTSRPYFQFYPGVRFYPATSKHAFAYALGFNLMAGTGKQWRQTSGYSTQGQYVSGYSYVNNFRLGMMLSNSLNFAPSPRLHIGLEFMLGFRYLNQYEGGNSNSNNYYNESLNGSPCVNFNMGIGYRF